MNEIDPSKPVVIISSGVVGKVIYCDVKGDYPLVVVFSERNGNECIGQYTRTGIHINDTIPTIRNKEAEEWRRVYKTPPEQKRNTGFDHYVGTISYDTEKKAQLPNGINDPDYIAVVRVK